MAAAGPAAGGCRCGAVRFTTSTAPLWVAHCHCADCRKATGAPFSTYAGYDDHTVDFTGSAAPAAFASSATATRQFCRHCGSPISYASARWPGELHLFVSQFDEPAAFVPQTHVFTKERLPWIHLDDGLPQFPEPGVEAHEASLLAESATTPALRCTGRVYVHYKAPEGQPSPTLLWLVADPATSSIGWDPDPDPADGAAAAICRLESPGVYFTVVEFTRGTSSAVSVRCRMDGGVFASSVGGNTAVSVPDASSAELHLYPWFLSHASSLETLPSVRSPQLGNSRDISVRLPPSYAENTTKVYRRVHIQWDGNKTGPQVKLGVDDELFASTVDALTLDGTIEEMVFIGIPSNAQRFSEMTPTDGAGGQSPGMEMFAPQGEDAPVAGLGDQVPQAVCLSICVSALCVCWCVLFLTYVCLTAAGLCARDGLACSQRTVPARPAVQGADRCRWLLARRADVGLRAVHSARLVRSYA